MINCVRFCFKVLRAKYKVGKKWLQAKPAKFTSFSWKCLEGVCPLLTQGACKLVGSRVDILVWEEPWILNHPLFRMIPNEPSEIPQSITDAQLMVHYKSAWYVEKLKSLFDESTVPANLSIPW